MLTCRTTGSPEPGISSRYQPTSTYTTKPSPRRRTSPFTSLYGGKLCFTRWTWFYPPSLFHFSASWCSTCRPKPEKKWHWVSAFSCHSLCSSCSYPKFCHRPRSSSRSLPNTCSSHSSWTRSQSWSLWSSSIGTSGKVFYNNKYFCTMLQKLSKCEVKAWLCWNFTILPLFKFYV